MDGHPTAQLPIFDYVSVGAQDATRANRDFLVQFSNVASAFGTQRIRIADTVGMASPWEVCRLIEALSKEVPNVALEFHGHNDLGMATANTVMAIEAGIDAVSVTVNGLGERAGNTPLEQVAMAVKLLSHRTSRIQVDHLTQLCRLVSEASERLIPVATPITGDAVFTHESDIHCAALLKDSSAYQPFPPKTVGRNPMQFVVGTHSGSSAIHHVLSEAGFFIGRQFVHNRYKAVVNTAKKRYT